jgi:superfamily II DNA/RNA helicase
LDIVIGTPGRILDFIAMKKLLVTNSTFMVIDEADRLLVIIDFIKDMGFEPQLKLIISQVRPDRQIVMWSATWPQEVRRLAISLVNNPVHINIGMNSYSINLNITQSVVICEEQEKHDLLIDLLKKLISKSEKIIVFCKKKMKCDVIAELCNSYNLCAEAIHGSKEQGQRESIYSNFKDNKNSILIATDIASRGLGQN